MGASVLRSSEGVERVGRYGEGDTGEALEGGHPAGDSPVEQTGATAGTEGTEYELSSIEYHDGEINIIRKIKGFRISQHI